MNEEILYHYMKHQSTARERAAIADWLEADASNRELLDRMSLEMETLALIAPEPVSYTHLTLPTNSRV